MWNERLPTSNPPRSIAPCAKPAARSTCFTKPKTLRNAKWWTKKQESKWKIMENLEKFEKYPSHSSSTLQKPQVYPFLFHWNRAPWKTSQPRSWITGSWVCLVIALHVAKAPANVRRVEGRKHSEEIGRLCIMSATDTKQEERRNASRQIHCCCAIVPGAPDNQKNASNRGVPESSFWGIPWNLEPLKIRHVSAKRKTSKRNWSQSCLDKNILLMNKIFHHQGWWLSHTVSTIPGGAGFLLSSVSWMLWATPWPLCHDGSKVPNTWRRASTHWRCLCRTLGIFVGSFFGVRLKHVGTP